MKRFSIRIPQSEIRNPCNSLAELKIFFQPATFLAMMRGHTTPVPPQTSR
jgi:hypothetical protein